MVLALALAFALSVALVGLGIRVVRGRRDSIGRGVNSGLEGEGLVRVDEVDGEQGRADP